MSIIKVHLLKKYIYTAVPTISNSNTHHQQQINMNLNNVPLNLITVFGLYTIHQRIS